MELLYKYLYIFEYLKKLLAGLSLSLYDLYLVKIELFLANLYLFLIILSGLP